MSKPNISIPARFAINGTKTDFSQTKITDGFNSVGPDILAGDNLNKLIDDIYQGLNGVLELYDTKVNKTGDTMSGGLTVSTNDTFIEGIKLKNTNIIAGNVPSTNSFTWLAFKDTNNVSVGGMYLRDTTNERELRLRVDSRDGNNDTFCIGYDANNKSYSTFPNTTCCDGQWVTKKLTVATEASSTSVATYSLSSYLPNDSYSYEVMLCFYFYDTGDTCGSCYFESDIFLTGNTNNSASQDVNNNLGHSFWFSQANTNARCISQVFTMPVGTGRYIKIKCTDANTQRYIYLAGYRRIGTNA